MQTVFLIFGVIFTTIPFFATADENENYYLTEDNNIGTRREGEYYDAYPGNWNIIDLRKIIQIKTFTLPQF